MIDWDSAAPARRLRAFPGERGVNAGHERFTNMQIIIQKNYAKLLALGLAVVIFVLCFIWIGKTYLAGVIARKPTVKNLETALRLDPGNSDDALDLGRIYQYTVVNARPELAIEYLTRAVRLNPFSPQAWLDLGSAWEFQGDDTKAEECMRRVNEIVPRTPNYQWALGNFFLLHNDVGEAFLHFKMVLHGNPGYEQAIYDTAWKASGDGRTILKQLIPRNPGAEIDYLNYLLATRRLNETQAVWDRIAADPRKFPAGSAAFYMDVLISTHQADQAVKVWTSLREKGLIPATDESTPQNLVENGDFENALLGFGFDWRVAGVNGVYVGLDDSAYHSAAKSLLIQFPGNQNVEYHNVYQFVPVSPNQHYHLSAFMKTQGITTDSGPSIEVKDAYNPVLLDLYTHQLTGTSPAWMPLTLDFKTGPKTSLIVVAVARVASQKFDNMIAGRVWIDDVKLTPSDN